MIVREDDVEEKLVVAAGTRTFSDQEIWSAIAFQERFFESRLVTSGDVHENGPTSPAHYRHLEETPDMVSEARRLAGSLRFVRSSSDDTGRLLRLLASQVSAGDIAEIGTGCGVGSAWTADALSPGVQFITVEFDETRSAAAGRLFAGQSGVTVLSGDWHVLQAYAPFAMLFADGGRAKENNPADLVDLVQPGCLIVMDDFTPLEQWPPEWWASPILCGTSG